jgi:hypothetical protein
MQPTLIYVKALTWKATHLYKNLRFDTLIEAEAEFEKAMDHGERAYILPPRANRLQP